jgi:hypothetical protein
VNNPKPTLFNRLFGFSLADNAEELIGVMASAGLR